MLFDAGKQGDATSRIGYLSPRKDCNTFHSPLTEVDGLEKI